MQTPEPKQPIAHQSTLHTMDSQELERSLHPSDYYWIDWIKDQQKNDYSFFKFDVTFCSSGICARPNHWLEYYQRKVILKIQKTIGASNKLIDVIREYEFDQHSRSYSGADWRCPHHIHAIIGVPRSRSDRMASFPMKRDIESLREVSSVWIDLIPETATDPQKSVEAAFGYMRKRKTFRPMS
jgi:hypothetical protein